MQFPESWLREFCNPPLSTQQLAELLTMSGFEVESLRLVAPPFTRIVVGEIVEAVLHPNADKLRVCLVNAGVHSKDGPLQVVCGAPNARAGIRVPLALVGAALPTGDDGKPFEIKVGKLRGVESFGMLCSAREPLSLEIGLSCGFLISFNTQDPNQEAAVYSKVETTQENPFFLMYSADFLEKTCTLWWILKTSLPNVTMGI